MSATMLADAVFSEAYRFFRNRTVVIWSTLFVPVAGLIFGVAGQMFLKQRMGEMTGARLPPGMLDPGTLDLGRSLVALAGGLANPMLLVFILIGAATLYAGDYRWESWRLTSARNTRANLILGKVGVAKLVTLSAVALYLAFGLVGEIAKGLIHGQAFAFTFGGEDAGHFGLLTLIGYIRIVQVGLLGLLAAVMTRSLVAALFVPLLVTAGQSILAPFLPAVGWTGMEWYAQALSPGLAYDTLKGVIVDDPMAAAVPVGTVWVAALSLIGWCVAPLAAAMVWFQRQDLSKE